MLDLFTSRHPSTSPTHPNRDLPAREKTPEIAAPLATVLSAPLKPMNNQQLADHVTTIINSQEGVTAEVTGRLGSLNHLNDFRNVQACYHTKLESMQQELQIRSKRNEIDRLDKQLEATREHIYLICSSDYHIEDHFKFKTFDDYDLDTPNALRDKPCDKLVESILEAYGHRNHGKYLSDRRDLRQSSWEADYVPPSVKLLVRGRFTCQSANLDAIHVVGDLRDARREMQEQATMQDMPKLVKFLREKKDVSFAEMLDFAERHDLEATLPSLRHLRQISGELDVLRRTEQQISALVAPLQVLRERIEHICATTLQTLEKKEHQRQIEIRKREIEPLLADPRRLSDFLQKNATATHGNLGAEYSRYATDAQKDMLVNMLAENQNSPFYAFTMTFVLNEIIALSKQVAQSAIDRLDHCLATFPRLALLSHVLPEQAEPEVSSLFKSLFSTPGFPLWMVDWRNHFKDELTKGKLPSAVQLSVDCAAFGRFKGFTVPMSDALRFSGRTHRRGHAEE